MAKNDEGDSAWSESGMGSTNENQAPEISNKTPSGREVDENTATGESVGAPFMATDPDEDRLTWTLSGTDAALFSIEGGQIRVLGALDHETGATRSVTVRVSDGAVSDTVDVAITVIDVDEPPSTPGAPNVSGVTRSSLRVSWTAPSNTGPPIDDYDVRYRESATGDWTGHAHTGDGTSTTIDGLKTSTRYEVQVKAGNPEGESSWSTSGEGLTKRSGSGGGGGGNRAPVIGNKTPSGREVAENSVLGTNVGDAFTATDPDGDSLTWTLSGADAGLFSIDDGQIKVNGTLDHEAAATRSVTVQVSDGAASDTVEVTITVTDVDEPPSTPDAPNISGASDTSLSVTWSAPLNTGPPIDDYDVRYRESATGDWTDHAHTGDGMSTTIGNLKEATTYEVQVKARNPEGESAWSASGTGSTSDPTGVNRAPVIGNRMASGREVVENSVSGTNVGDAFTAADPDGDSLTWTLSGADAGLFSMDDGQIRVAGALDHEAAATRNVTVQVSDGTASDTVDVIVTVIDLNEAPEITNKTPSGREVVENSVSGTNVGDAFTATDADGDSLTWTLSGADAGLFSIEDGQIRVAGALDHEAAGTRSVTVQVSDGAASDTMDVMVTVIDSNEAPEITNRMASGREVDENSVSGTNVGDAFTATDPDGDALTWTLSGADAGLFSMDDGQIRVAGALDHEAAATRNVTVQVSDGTASDTVEVKITVTDVDEPSVLIVSTSALTVTEAPGAGRSVEYTVRLSAAPSGSVAVGVSSDDTNVARVEPESLTFTAGNWSDAQTVTVTGVDDAIDNDGRGAKIAQAAAGGGYDGIRATVLVSLIDDDADPVATLTFTPASISENGGVSVVTAALDRASSEETVITISVAEAATGDFTLSANTTLTIPAGATASTGEVTVTAVDNAVDTADRTVTVSGAATNPGGVTGPADALLTIADDDTVGIALSVSSLTLEEGAEADYAVKLLAQPSEPVSLSVSSDDIIVARIEPESLTFTPDDWSDAQAVTVTAVDDAIDNDGRGAIIVHRASGGSYEGVAAALLNVSVVDDDEAMLSVTAASVPEGDSGVSELTFEVTLSPLSSSEVAARWATSDGTASAGDDYEAASGTLTFAPRETVRRLTVRVFGDARPEGDETVRVTLSDSQGASLDERTALGVIIDDDAAKARGEAVGTVLAGLGRTLASDAVDAVSGRVGSGVRIDCGAGGLGPLTAPTGLASQAQGSSSAAGWLGSTLPQSFEARVGGGAGESADCLEGYGIWGRITDSRFDAESGGYGADGQLRTGYLGVDRWVNEGLLLGVALSHSRADIDFGLTDWMGYQGQSEASLTAIQPYARINFAGGALWGLLGGGAGEIELEDRLGAEDTQLAMGMAAVGWRRELDLCCLGLDMAFKGDAFSTWMSSDMSGDLPEARAEAQRIRALMEGSLDLPGSEVSNTRLRLEAGGRWDGGDASGGVGLEVGLSLSHRNSRLGLELQAGGRYTVLHQADRFEDRSLSLAVSFDPGVAGQGLRMSLAPSWGSPGDGSLRWLAEDRDSLTDPGTLSDPDSSWDGWRPSSYEATVGYGWGEPEGRPRDMYATLTEAGHSGKEFRLGGRMALDDQAGLTMSLELMRQQRPGVLPDHGVQLRFGQSLRQAVAHQSGRDGSAPDTGYVGGSRPTVLAAGSGVSTERLDASLPVTPAVPAPTPSSPDDGAPSEAAFAATVVTPPHGDALAETSGVSSAQSTALAPTAAVAIAGGSPTRAVGSAQPAVVAHWISIGAFRSVSAAGRLAVDAARATGLSFSVRPGDEPGLNRVVTGPYRNAADAKKALGEIRAQNLDGWTYRREAPPASPVDPILPPNEPAPALVAETSAETTAQMGAPASSERAAQGVAVLPGGRSTPVAPVVPAATTLSEAHWISIGAFRSRSAAERLAADAANVTGLPFSVRSGDKPDLKRVVNGPYNDKVGARKALGEIRARGYDAWTYRSEV